MTETGVKAGTNLTQGLCRGTRVKKRLCIAVGVVLAGVILPLVVVPIAKPWSEINCRHQDINIKTGQARYSRYLWYVKISEEIRDTPISVILEGKTIDVVDIKPWHRVNTFSPGLRHSPHYRYHSALHQARQIELVGELNELGLEEKRVIAKNVLKLWQTERSDYPVGDYLQSAFKEGMKEPEQD